MTPAELTEYALEHLRCLGRPIHMDTLISIVFSRFYESDSYAQRGAVRSVLDRNLRQRSDVSFGGNIFTFVSCDPCSHADCIIRRVHSS